jgi:hypothetical protein
VQLEVDPLERLHGDEALADAVQLEQCAHRIILR